MNQTDREPLTLQAVAVAFMADPATHSGDCLFRDRVRLFDAIEFEPRFSTIDALYDLAFTLMDLLYCGRRDFALLVLSRYLVATCDYGACALCLCSYRFALRSGR